MGQGWEHTFIRKMEATQFVVLQYTIIDFNEVDIRIYLPKKVIIH